MGMRFWLRHGTAYFFRALVIQRGMAGGKNDGQRPYCWIYQASFDDFSEESRVI